MLTARPLPAGLPASSLRSSRRCTCISGTTDVQERQALKDRLVRSTANTRRGKNASAQQQQDILKAVEQLEAVTPTSNPAMSELINGRWSLLYNGPGQQDDLNWEKRTGGVEGPVLRALRPLSVNAVRSKGITQVIDSKAGKVENIAEFTVAGRFDGFLNVEGTVAPVVPESASSEAVRVDVKFTSFQLKIGSLPGLQIPLNWISPTGWVDTTYVDKDVRIGRGDKGSVFVTIRQKDKQ